MRGAARGQPRGRADPRVARRARPARSRSADPAIAVEAGDRGARAARPRGAGGPRARGDVREVHSQAPVLRQCRDLLRALDAIPIETHDTAYAAFRVTRSGRAAGGRLLGGGGARGRPPDPRGGRLGRAPEHDAVLEARSRRASREPIETLEPDARAARRLLRRRPGLVRARRKPAPRSSPCRARRRNRCAASRSCPRRTSPAPPPRTARPRRGRARRLARARAGVRAPAADEGHPESDGGARAERRLGGALRRRRRAPRGDRRAVRGRIARAGRCASRAPSRARARRPSAAASSSRARRRTRSRGTASTRSRWLKDAGDAVGLPIVTEVMAPAQVVPVAARADVLQIGARNCQNYDLLKEAGASGRPVFLKRGFGTTVEEWLSSAEYLLDAGCTDVILCERGHPHVREGDARNARPRRPPRRRAPSRISRSSRIPRTPRAAATSCRASRARRGARASTGS